MKKQIRLLVAVATSMFAVGLLADWAQDFDEACGSAVAFRSSSSVFPISDMLYHWKMNDNAADRVVIENFSSMTTTSAVNNTSAMTSNGVINSCLVFNGTADRLVLTNNCLGSIGTNNFTVMFWMNVHDNTTVVPGYRNDLGIIMGGWNKFLIRLEYISYPGDYPHLNLAITDAGEQKYEEMSYALHQWTHMAFVRTNTIVKGYKDGVLVVTRDYEGNANSIAGTSSQAYRIGHDAAIPDWLYKGALDDVRVYRKGLASNEVWAIYNNGSGTEEE